MYLAPAGRHVYSTRQRGATGDSETREENLTQRRKAAKTQGKAELSRGWVPQPVGRGNLAPTMAARVLNFGAFSPSGAACL